MSHADTWTQPNPTVLETQLRLGSTRLLFGLPCLFAGIYFLYQYLIMAFVAYAQAGDWLGIARDQGEWMASASLSLVFLVPAWLLLFYRRYVRLDTALDELVVVQDVRVFKHATHHQLKDFNRVVVLWHDIKKSRQDLYSVELYRTDETSVLVASMPLDNQAEKLGGAVATMLGLPLLSMSKDEWRRR